MIEPQKMVLNFLFYDLLSPLMNKLPPYVALSLSAQIHYCREVLFGIFDYVHKNHPWIYITGGIGEAGWKFPVEAKECAVLGMFTDGPFVRSMARRKIPLVNVSEKDQGIGMARVLPDNVAAGRMAAEYFLQKKFTNFAYSGCDDFAFSKLRHHGFEEALREAGHKCSSLNFGHGKWPRDSMDPLPEIGEWLHSLPRPCAVFTHGDDHARRVLNECRRLNILVPDEIAVLGCDNDEIECEFSPTPISSVSFPLRQLGFEAAAMVDFLLAGKVPEFATVRLAPSGIVTRRSTDMVAIQDPTIARAMRFIASNAAQPISVGHVVKACGASRRYLERRFNSLLGVTPKQEILRVRVGIAKRLLAQTSLLMPEVAEAAGFTDAKMLSSIFARDVGMSPSDYRRSVKPTIANRDRKL
jgi:LacI family transcriptional regulator